MLMFLLGLMYGILDQCDPNLEEMYARNITAISKIT